MKNTSFVISVCRRAFHYDCHHTVYQATYIIQSRMFNIFQLPDLACPLASVRLPCSVCRSTKSIRVDGYFFKPSFVVGGITGKITGKRISLGKGSQGFLSGNTVWPVRRVLVVGPPPSIIHTGCPGNTIVCRCRRTGDLIIAGCQGRKYIFNSIASQSI